MPSEKRTVMWSLTTWLSGLVNPMGSCIVPGSFSLGAGGQISGHPSGHGVDVRDRPRRSPQRHNPLFVGHL